MSFTDHRLVLERMTEDQISAFHTYVQSLPEDVLCPVVSEELDRSLREHAMVLYLDSQPVAFCGSSTVEGLPELWLVVTVHDAIQRCARLVIRLLKQGIEILGRYHRWSKVRCMVLQGSPLCYHRFVDLLGFRAVGLRTDYGPAKQSFVLYELSYQ